MNQTLMLQTDLVHERSLSADGQCGGFNLLLKLIGEARLVLLGEATHGTNEFYREHGGAQRLAALPSSQGRILRDDLYSMHASIEAVLASIRLCQ